jgi:hypothetical protein
MNGKGPRRDAEKERFWRKTIDEQCSSGQSVRGYCGRKGLSEPSFYAWRRELQRRDGRPAVRKRRRQLSRARLPERGRPAFVAVRVGGGSIPPTVASIECLLPSGAVLRLPADMGPAKIAAVVRHWEQWSC